MDFCAVLCPNRSIFRQVLIGLCKHGRIKRNLGDSIRGQERLKRFQPLNDTWTLGGEKHDIRPHGS